MMLQRYSCEEDPEALLLAKSRSQYLPIITDLIDELCLEETSETLALDVEIMLEEMTLARRAELLLNREWLGTRIKMLNHIDPAKTLQGMVVEFDDIHNTWLQTSDEAIWREDFHNGWLRYVNIETGEILRSEAVLGHRTFVYREDVLWFHLRGCEFVRFIMREWLEREIKNVQKNFGMDDGEDISIEWKLNFLLAKFDAICNGGISANLYVRLRPWEYMSPQEVYNCAKQVSLEQGPKLTVSTPKRSSWLRWKKRTKKRLGSWRRWLRLTGTSR